MKPAQLLTLGVAALMAVSGMARGDEPAPAATTGTRDVLAVIHSRKSVRTYQDKPVPQAQLEPLLRAGMAAPTAADRRPWAFVVVTARPTLLKLADALMYGTMLKTAGAAIVVFGTRDRFLPKEAAEMWVQDCSAATENILLAAEGTGLGAVWLGVYPVPERMTAVAKAVAAPDTAVPLCVISIGWPGGNEQPKNKYDPSRIHWEKW